MIYDVSYYTDENGQAHEVRHVSQIVENKAEKVINYMPENKDYNYNCYEVTQMEPIFGDYYYYIDLNENDEMCNPEQFEEEAMEYFGEKNHPSRLHIVVTQYSLPEGAYITENTVDHTCYIDNVIEEAQTLKLK